MSSAKKLRFTFTQLFCQTNILLIKICLYFFSAFTKKVCSGNCLDSHQFFRKCMYYLVFPQSKYTEDEISEINETFSLFDTRGDSKIFAHQMGDVLRALHMNPTEQEIKKCGYSQNPGIYTTHSLSHKYLWLYSQNPGIYTTHTLNHFSNTCGDTPRIQISTQLTHSAINTCGYTPRIQVSTQLTQSFL